MEGFSKYFDQSDYDELISLVIHHYNNTYNTTSNTSEWDFDFDSSTEETDKDDDASNNLYRWIYMAPNLIFAMNVCSLVIGLAGNIIACTVILRGKIIYTSTNYYLLNLSLSDVLFLITRAPFEIYSSYYRYQIQYNSAIICFLHYWSFQTSANVSTFTVTVFTMERYLAICHPFAARSMLKISRVKKIIVFIWFLAALLSLTPLVLNKFTLEDYSHPHECHIDFDPEYAVLFSILFFFIPTAVITTMYILIGMKLKTSSKDRKIRLQANNDAGRTLKMLVLIVAAFVICWAPFYISEMIMFSLSNMIQDLKLVDIPVEYYGKDFSEFGFDDFTYEYNSAYVSFQIIRFLFTLKSITYMLAPTVNPIIYTMMSKNFRRGFKELVSDFRSGSFRRSSSSKWRLSSSGANPNAALHYRVKTISNP